MDEFEIADILKKQPEKISEVDYGIMSPFSWFEVLRKQPQLAQYCDLSKLYPCFWVGLMEEYPEFDAKCDCWSEFDKELWTALLKERPDLAERCPFEDLAAEAKKRLEGDDFLDQVLDDPQFGEPDRTGMGGERFLDI